MPPRLLLEPRGSSLSFRPLQRSQSGEVTIHTPNLPRSDYDAARGFSPPRRLDSSPNPAGLFHPTHAPGVSPSRAFLLRGSRDASRRPLPSGRSHRTFLTTHPSPDAMARGKRSGRRSDSTLACTALLHRESCLLTTRGLDVASVRSSPGLCSSSGRHPGHLGSPFGEPPPTDSATSPFHPAEAM